MTNIEKARLEQAVAELSDAEFDDLVARTRPPRVTPTNWRDSVAQKTAQLAGLIRNADKNGHQR